MLKGLVAGQGPTSADVAASVVQAVYGRVKAQSPTNASKVGPPFWAWQVVCSIAHNLQQPAFCVMH